MCVPWLEGSDSTITIASVGIAVALELAFIASRWATASSEGLTKEAVKVVEGLVEEYVGHCKRWCEVVRGELRC